MGDIFVYGPKDTTTALEELKDCTVCKTKEHIQGPYELSLSYPLRGEPDGEILPAVPFLQPFYQVQAGGQIFRIFHVDIDDTAYPRKASHVVNVLARHIFYDLAYYVIDDLLLEDVSCQAAMEGILAAIGLTGVYSVAGMPGANRTIHIQQKNAAEAMLSLAKEWGGVLLRDNTAITITSPELPEEPISVRYGKNLIGIRELRHSDEVVTQVYPIGADELRLPEEYVTNTDWNDAQYPGFPISRVVSFPQADTEEDLRAQAEAYLADHAEWEDDTAYHVDCILLEDEAQEEAYGTEEDLLDVQVGDAVLVEHDPLGLDFERQVLSVERDVLLAINTRVELGKPVVALNHYLEDLEGRLRDTNAALRAAQRVQRWAEEVLQYVESILGGGLVNVHPKLLLATPVTFYYGSHRKLLVEVCTVLASVTPTWVGASHTQRFTVDAPMAEIRRQSVRTIAQAFTIIDTYIKDSIGFISGSNKLVQRVNSAYATGFGPGQVAAVAEDTVETAFPDWVVGTPEYQNAWFILNTLQTYVGNVSELYLEIGGGSSGVIGAINEAFRLLHERSMTVSTEGPDNSVGKDGDLWLKFEEE